MAAVFDMAVGKHPDMLGAQLAAIAQGFGGSAFYKAFVGDIGVGPLINPDKIGSARQRGGKGRQCRIG